MWVTPHQRQHSVQVTNDGTMHPSKDEDTNETGFDVRLKRKREQRWLLSHTPLFNVCEMNTVKCLSSVFRSKGVRIKVKETSS